MRNGFFSEPSLTDSGMSLILDEGVEPDTTIRERNRDWPKVHVKVEQPVNKAPM